MSRLPPTANDHPPAGQISTLSLTGGPDEGICQVRTGGSGGGGGGGGFNSDASSSSSSAGPFSSSPFTPATTLTPSSVVDIPLPPKPQPWSITSSSSSFSTSHRPVVHSNTQQQQQQQQHRHFHDHSEPVIPSTFLPSYYSEVRSPPSSCPFPSISTSSALGPTSTTTTQDEESENFSWRSSLWDKLSRSGPSAHHLLDGIKLPSLAPPFLNQNGGSSKIIMGGAVGSDSGTPMMDLAGARHTVSTWNGAEGEGGSSGVAGDPSNWAPRPQIATSSSSLSQAGGPGPSTLSNQQARHVQHTKSPTPSVHHRSLSNASASPHAPSHLAPPTHSISASAPGASSSTTHLSPRFHPYPHTNTNTNTSSKSMTSASPLQQSMAPPPHPRSASTSNSNDTPPSQGFGINNTNNNSNGNSISNSNVNPGRAWSEPTTFQDPVPQSAGYPGILFGSVNLPEGFNSVPPNGGRAVEEARLGPEDYAQALAIYNHLLSSLPHIAPNTDPAPDTSGQGQTPGYPFDTLISLASNGLSLLTGQSPLISLGLSDIIPSNADGIGIGSVGANAGIITDGTQGKGKRRNSHSGENGDSNGGGPGGAITSSGSGNSSEKKAMTRCLGCGATETPEWRRGPMGPRTLCNACGLVHMKLQRKKKKAEEKARAAAAAAAGGEAGG